MFKRMDMYHHSIFLTKFWRISKGYMSLPHATSCDVLNNPNVEELDESSLVHYHLPPTPQFEHVENLGNDISSGWTPWVQHTTGYSSGEVVVGQVF